MVIALQRKRDHFRAVYAKADGKGHHLMVVHQSFGNGDFLYCQHGGPKDAKMRRFFDVLHSPNLSLAQYRLYHVVANNVLEGLSENCMYRDADRAEVYLAVNRGLFWVQTSEEVSDFGGWGNVTVLPAGTLGVYGGRIPIPGTMVREESAPSVYLSDGFTKHWVRTAAAVMRLGGWDAIRVVPDDSLSTVFTSTGSDVWN